MKTITLLATIVIVAMTNQVNAALVDVPVTTVLGTQQNISDVIVGAQNSNALSGVSVTALFSNGSSDSTIFTLAGSAIGSGWSLASMGNDTWTGSWTIQNTSAANIVGFILNGLNGNTVFDIVLPGDPIGTQGSVGFGSGQGGMQAEASFGFIATYSDIVAITGSTAVGDLFATLRVDMNALGAGNSRQFFLDTDQVSYSTIPVPAAIWLMASGMLGLIGVARRKKVL